MIKTGHACVIGITGCVGVGKSTVLSLFKKRGAVILSADIILSGLYLPGNDIYKQIVEFFGPSVIAEDGSIDRQSVISLLKDNELLFEKLGDITHPGIIEVLRERIKQYAKTERVIAIEAPLLFECKMEEMMDYIIVVCADDNIVEKRMEKNIYFDREAFCLFKRHQWIQEQKIKYADHVIVNNGSFEYLEEQVSCFWLEKVSV